MRFSSAALLVAALAAAPLTGAYAARSFPRAVTLPALPIEKQAVDVHLRGESEFILRDKTEVHRGKVWLGYLDYRGKWGADKRGALDAIVASLKKGGWEVMMIDEPRQPPLATLRLTTDDNQVMWASVEMFETARLLVLEQDES
ncbi:MAG: hypothetical protein H7Y14_02490 [Burkholderiales bacterium]|nr:hypothetical protein [Burkholderiales bacterium]